MLLVYGINLLRFAMFIYSTAFNLLLMCLVIGRGRGGGSLVQRMVVVMP